MGWESGGERGTGGVGEWRGGPGKEIGKGKKGGRKGRG